MKQIIVKELEMTPVCEACLLILTENQKKMVRDAILQKEFLAFSTGKLQIFQKERNTFIVSDDTKMMTAEFYSALMGYFYNEKAFSEKEKEHFLYPISDAEYIDARQLYIAADELLTFKAEEFLPIIKKLIKDTTVKAMTDDILLTSVRFAFLEQISKL